MGVEPVCTELLGTDAFEGNLISVDLLTGNGTIIGNMGFPAPSLAFDPTTGILYAGEGSGNPNLYTVDPSTGVATLVGNTGLGEAAIGGMDFRSDGTLFAAVNIVGAAGTGSDHLAIIDKNTGAATVIGPFGTCTGGSGGSCTIEGMEAIAFNETGTLFGAVRVNPSTVAGTPGLYTINSNTGAATFLRPILNLDGSTPSGGVVSLQFCNGILFGGTSTAIGDQATDSGKLIIIDPATGFWSFVGTGSATGGTSLGGLAGIILSVTCPDDITVFNELGRNGAFVNFPGPTVSPGVTAVCTPASGSFFPRGTTTVTCTATDVVGNTITCSFNVKVVVDPCRFFRGRGCC